MPTLTLRQVKGSPLTSEEVDNNFLFSEEQALIAEEAAEESAQSAQISASAANLYETISIALDNTQPGQYFLIPDSSSDFSYDVYLHQANGTEILVTSVISPNSVEEAAQAAENFSNIAQLSGSLYDTIADGLSGTVDGDFFAVVSSEDSELWNLYQNDNGDAVLRKTFNSFERLEQAVLEAEQSRDTATSAASAAETAQGISESARDDAQTAQGLSETARNDSQDARDDALLFRNKAEEWAESPTEVEQDSFSAKFWAGQAAQVVSDGIIDDGITTQDLTWSSQKIDAEIDLHSSEEGGVHGIPVGERALHTADSVGDPWTKSPDSIDSITYSGDNVTAISETVDGLTRSTSITYNGNGTVDTVTITYDGVTRTETYSYDGAGNVTGMTVTEV